MLVITIVLLRFTCISKCFIKNALLKEERVRRNDDDANAIVKFFQPFILFGSIVKIIYYTNYTNHSRVKCKVSRLVINLFIK